MANPNYLACYYTVPIRRGPTQGTDEHLTATLGTLDYFNLWQLPRISTLPVPTSSSDPTCWPQRGLANPKQQWRIAYPRSTASRGIARVRFRLTKGATQATLQVLAEHLESTGVPWLWLCDVDGARVPNQLLASRSHLIAA